MKTHPSLRPAVRFGAAGLVLSLVTAGLYSAPAPRLNFRESPLAREVKHATSFAPVAKSASASVVNIYTSKRLRDSLNPFYDDSVWRYFFGGPGPESRLPRERRMRSLGSGVIVSADGYILTNHHVVDGADDIRVGLADGKEYAAKLVGADAQTDIAVLVIDATGLPAITLTDSDKVEVGDAVLAIGNPFGVGQTVTVGHVGGLGRGGIGIADYEDFIQTDASINPGNSGGALVDAEGRLIGINTAIMSRSGMSAGMGFAVPSNLARAMFERIVQDGKVARGYLGVLVQPVNEELAKEFKLPRAEGALVAELARSSPGEEAGIKEGDVIVEFDGKKISDSRHLRLLVAQMAPGTKVTLKVIRDGKEQTLKAELGELRPSRARASIRQRDRTSDYESDELFDGVTVAELDSRRRREFDVPLTVHGTIVTTVDPVSSAGVAGLRTGDVITQIDRQPVRNVDEAIKLTRGKTGAGRVLLRLWREHSSLYLIIPLD